MKRIGAGPVTPREARVAAKLCEILYSDQYHPEEKRVLRAWIRAHAKAQEMKREGYTVSIPVHPGRPQVIVVNGVFGVASLSLIIVSGNKLRGDMLGSCQT